jgi:hypothetical protein
MSTKSFTFNVPAVKLTDQDFLKINEAIKTAELKASANIIGNIIQSNIDYAIYHNFTIANVGQKVSKIVMSPTVWSKSKQFNSTATQVILEFFKNGKLKKVTAERVNFSNQKCYSGYSSTKAIFE